MAIQNPSLERAANLAVICAAVFCVGMWVWHFGFNIPRRPAPTQQHVEGDNLSGVAELAEIEANRRLIVFVNSLCRYCTDSMPFYSKLATDLKNSSASTRLVFVSRETPAIMKEYLKAHGLDSEDQIALGETTTFRTTATPTLLLLDSTKVVRRIWTGLLAEGQQEAVARIVLGPSQPQ